MCCMCYRYSKNLVAAKQAGIKKSAVAGAGIGITYCTMFSLWCVIFWYGGKLVRQGEINVADLIIVSIFLLNARCFIDIG
jgi:hypothetical protein